MLTPITVVQEHDLVISHGELLLLLASCISFLNACIASLPLPFSIITSRHIFEVGVQILLGFSMKLAIDLFQWESSLADYMTELHS